MPVNPAGVKCRCGAIGCWETEIGEEALLRLAGRPESGGRPAVDAVLAAAEAGDAQAGHALNTVGHWLGLGLAGLVNIFDPELIVLGGRFARLAPFVGPIVERELDSRALAASRNIVRVVPAVLSDDAPLLGAAELALEPLLADPAQWLGPRAAPKGDLVSGNGQWRAVA
jgi:predicted NBD/HSP70 family sugar kinase